MSFYVTVTNKHGTFSNLGDVLHYIAERVKGVGDTASIEVRS